MVAISGSNWKLASALVQLMAEVDAKWPNRDRSTDGSIGDSAHSARKSEHNPDSNRRVNAVDIDKGGIDTDFLLSKLIADPRVWYVIWDKHIYSRTYGFAKRPYSGANAHTEHLHVSLYPNNPAGNSGASWDIAEASKPAPKPVEKPAAAKPESAKLVKLDKGVTPGKRHAQVRLLQQLLIKAGYGPIKGAVTTFYGKNTKDAVARFHKANPKFSSGGYDPVIGPKGFEELQKLAG